MRALGWGLGRELCPLPALTLPLRKPLPGLGAEPSCCHARGHGARAGGRVQLCGLQEGGAGLRRLAQVASRRASPALQEGPVTAGPGSGYFLCLSWAALRAPLVSEEQPWERGELAGLGSPYQGCCRHPGAGSEPVICPSVPPAES